MGKLKENWVLILVEFTLGILTIILSLSLSAKQSQNVEREKQIKASIESKLNITDFNKHEGTNKEEFEKIYTEREKDRIRVDNKLDELLRISLTTQANVGWLIGEKKKERN